MDIWGGVKKLLGTGAPILANAILPGSGGIAKSLVAGILGVDAEDPKAMEQALQNASPEQWAKLKEIEMKHEERLLEIGAEKDKAILEDVQNARRTEIERLKSGSSNKPLYLLAAVVVVGFFSLVGILIFRSTAIPEGSREIAFILLGALASSFTAVMQYFFGSSLGSAIKTNFIAKNGGLK